LNAFREAVTQQILTDYPNWKDYVVRLDAVK
jgi:hypothetical protein